MKLRRQNTLALALLVGLASSFAAPTTRAQDGPSEEELERARAAFGEGVAHTEAEEWDEAVARFREVAQVRDTSPVLYNLAFALAHTDGRAEAVTLLHRVLTDPELAEGMRTQAQAVLEETEPTVGQVTLRLLGDEAGEQIFFDGEEIGLDRIGQPIYVDPGSHTAELRHGDTLLGTRTVEVVAGAHEEVTLSGTSVLHTELTDEEREGSSGEPGIHEQWWLWAAVGGGVVVLGAIIIGIAVAASSRPSAQAGDLDPGVLWVRP